MRNIGSIYACIQGDMRYGTAFLVKKDESGTVFVVLESTTPVGGMDGPSGVGNIHETQILCKFPSDVKPGLLLKTLKYYFKTVDAGTVQRWGKPTKNFTWNMPDGRVEYGFNQALAKEALSWC